MVNRISELKREEIERLAYEGLSLRAIHRTTGIAKDTVRKYYPESLLSQIERAPRPYRRTPGVKRGGNNILPTWKQEEIKRIAREHGLGIRAITRVTGIDEKTVRRYFPSDALCECGRSADHRGWCAPRFAKSEARQKTMRTLQQSPFKRKIECMEQEAAKLGLIWKDGTWVKARKREP